MSELNPPRLKPQQISFRYFNSRGDIDIEALNAHISFVVRKFNFSLPVQSFFAFLLASNAIKLMYLFMNNCRHKGIVVFRLRKTNNTVWKLIIIN